jgi:predicted nucleic acid-binding protein
LSRFVLDSSLALEWYFAEQKLGSVNALLPLAMQYGIVIPAMSLFEVPGALARRVRNGIPEPLARGYLRSLMAIPTFVDRAHLDADYRMRLFELAASTRLSAYDAAFLDVAERLGLPLATLDRDLRKAAARRGVTVWPDLP